MCGILGFVDKQHRLSPGERERLWRTMIAAVAHRGGEGDGVYQAANVTLAHTRLRILDLHPRSDQPFANPQCCPVLTFNGQIYNHRALRAELGRDFTYRTESDTETLLYAYARWGRGFVEHLRGMYSFGIWDDDSREVTLGVDPLGIKPLYYLNTDAWFAWSSEVKPLLLLPGVQAQLGESALHEFLCYRALSGSRTMFAGIHRLMPAQMAVYDTRRDTLRLDTYWRPESVAPADAPSVDDVREALLASIAEHAPADVPVGIQLSGGLDSSLIARLLRDELPQSYELHSYCIGAADTGYGEFGYARQAARSVRTIHHEIPFDDETFAESLHRATYHLDEPINHPNTVPLMHLAAEARKSVTVLFSGEGADELFCGYKRHVRFLREPASAMRLAQSNQVNSHEVAGSVLRDPEAAGLNGHRLALAEAVAHATPARQLTIYDLHHHLPGHLLRQDKMGMAANLETRVPFLDRRLVDLALALPDAQKITLNNRTGGDRKRVLRQIGDGVLPSAIHRRQKRGFGLPVARWLRNSAGLGRKFKRLLIDEQRRSFLNYPAIQHLFARHQKGTEDHSDVLWPLLTLEVWCRCFLDGEGAPKPKRKPARLLEPA